MNDPEAIASWMTVTSADAVCRWIALTASHRTKQQEEGIELYLRNAPSLNYSILDF